MKQAIFLLLLLSNISSYGQLNCNAFLYNGDSLQYKACKLVERVEKKYYQFSKEYQEGLDKALEIYPYFAYAYREKAAPYVKSGDFITWKKLIDKAVEYDPLQYLGVRASLRYKFFADYKGAIADIEQLDSMVTYDIGPTSNGTYHLNVVKALCHKELGKKRNAIEILVNQIETETYIGAFDYLHLGVLYLNTQMYDEAIAAFEKQKEQNNLAENHYYSAMVFKEIGQIENCIELLKEAKILYEDGYHMHDPYSQLIDEIYLEDIEKELKTAYHTR
ncbi:tetratricopeptide repeat protein [Xanthovirga aplysinae]|uniref:tetratricopeptide repeat protein n=1 Tax=Xanthovirga aplysinae TaxID=2529853 RepID=UPI0012BB5A1A|nr:hypothetical protein [Xanthovirga aplysinae]MTI32420.1 hypothetical protein [Xanthovirga aplysinae]